VNVAGAGMPQCALHLEHQACNLGEAFRAAKYSLTERASFTLTESRVAKRGAAGGGQGGHH